MAQQLSTNKGSIFHYFLLVKATEPQNRATVPYGIRVRKERNLHVSSVEGIDNFARAYPAVSHRGVPLSAASGKYAGHTFGSSKDVIRYRARTEPGPLFLQDSRASAHAKLKQTAEP